MAQPPVMPARTASNGSAVGGEAPLGLSPRLQVLAVRQRVGPPDDFGPHRPGLANDEVLRTRVLPPMRIASKSPSGGPNTVAHGPTPRDGPGSQPAGDTVRAPCQAAHPPHDKAPHDTGHHAREGPVDRGDATAPVQAPSPALHVQPPQQPPPSSMHPGDGPQLQPARQPSPLLSPRFEGSEFSSLPAGVGRARSKREPFERVSGPIYVVQDAQGNPYLPPTLDTSRELPPPVVNLFNRFTKVPPYTRIPRPPVERQQHPETRVDSAMHAHSNHYYHHSFAPAHYGPVHQHPAAPPRGRPLHPFPSVLRTDGAHPQPEPRELVHYEQHSPGWYIMYGRHNPNRHAPPPSHPAPPPQPQPHPHPQPQPQPQPQPHPPSQQGPPKQTPDGSTPGRPNQGSSTDRPTFGDMMELTRFEAARVWTVREPRRRPRSDEPGSSSRRVRRRPNRSAESSTPHSQPGQQTKSP